MIKAGKKNLNRFKSLFKNGSYLLTVFLLGVVMVLAGVIINKSSQQQDSQVEILEVDESQQQQQQESDIFVNVSGAVINPGLYQLPADSRVNDVLVKAGGIAEKADRSWIDKNVNLAQKLKDGVKVYIPYLNDSNDSKKVQGVAVEKSNSDQINVNVASKSQLEELWGIGPVTAQEIIDGRPFGSVDELKELLNSNVYEKNKDKLSVF